MSRFVLLTILVAAISAPAVNAQPKAARAKQPTSQKAGKQKNRRAGAKRRLLKRKGRNAVKKLRSILPPKLIRTKGGDDLIAVYQSVKASGKPARIRMDYGTLHVSNNGAPPRLEITTGRRSSFESRRKSLGLARQLQGFIAEPITVTKKGIEIPMPKAGSARVTSSNNRTRSRNSGRTLEATLRRGTKRTKKPSGFSAEDMRKASEPFASLISEAKKGGPDIGITLLRGKPLFSSEGNFWQGQVRDKSGEWRLQLFELPRDKNKALRTMEQALKELGVNDFQRWEFVQAMQRTGKAPRTWNVEFERKVAGISTLFKIKEARPGKRSPQRTLQLKRTFDGRLDISSPGAVTTLPRGKEVEAITRLAERHGYSKQVSEAVARNAVQEAFKSERGHLTF